MKRIIYFILAIFLITLGCTMEEKSPIEGTWQLLSYTIVSADTTFTEYIPEENLELIIIGEQYSCSIWQEERESVSDTLYNGFFFHSYTYEDGVLTTSTLHSNIPSAIGEKYISNVEFKGDTMISTTSDFPDFPDITNISVHIRYK